MEYIKNLNEERIKALNEQRAVLQVAAAAKRVVTADEQLVIDRTDAAIDQYDREIKDWTQREKRDAEAAAAAEAYAPIVAQQAKLSQQGEDEFESMVAFMRGDRPGNADRGRAWDLDLTAVAREKTAIRAGGRGSEILTAVLKGNLQLANALSSTVSTAGGNLVPTDFVRSLYDYLEVYAGIRAVATILTTEGGNPLEFPKVLSGGTAVLVGEGTAIAGTDPSFGKMTLTSWKYAELVRSPYELLEDNGVDLEGFLAKDFGRAIGRATNAAYTTGNGSSAPEGVMTVIGTALTGANGGTGVFTYDNLIDLKYAVNSEYADSGSWMMRRATMGRARKLTDGGGHYLWQPNAQAGQPDTLDGDRVVENPAMAAVGLSALSVAYGDFSAFYIRDVGSVRISRSDDRYFDTDEVAWKAALRTDSGLIDLTGAVLAYRGGTA